MKPLQVRVCPHVQDASFERTFLNCKLLQKESYMIIFDHNKVTRLQSGNLVMKERVTRVTHRHTLAADDTPISPDLTYKERFSRYRI